MSSDDFYVELISHDDFDADASNGDFHPVPEDWIVIAADVVRSRDAIAEGRYKQVNMVGAAVIAAVLNVLDRERIPFVFGGDGATLVVPSSMAAVAGEAVAGVVGLARNVMGLELRAAAIPVEEIRRRGADIRVRKFQLSPGNHLAMIIGDGLIVADRILKDPEAAIPFSLKNTQQEPELDGLSCRWEPLQAQNGHIVSLIVKPTDMTEMTSILEGIAANLGINPRSDGAKLKLAQKPRLKFRFPPRGLPLEVSFSMRGSWVKGYLKVVLECLVFLYGYSTGRRIGPFDPVKYFEELSLNTDHRKLGDSLQLVLDLTPDQLKALNAHLEDQHQAGQLVFGLHVSGSALMTCFMQDVEHNQHIHFVDGADGGLSLAATDFKERLSALGRNVENYAAPIA